MDRILGELGEAMPSGKARGELLPITRGGIIRCRLSAKCWRIGPKLDRTACVRVPGIRTLRRSRSRVSWWLALFTRALVFTKKVLDLLELGISAFGGGVATLLVRDDPARRFGTGGQHALEEPFRCCLIALFLQQDVEFGAVLIDRSPQLRLAA